MQKFYTATQARKNFFQMLKEAQKPGVSIAITHGGQPKVVMMSFEDFEGWQETWDIMSNPEEMAAIEEALKDKDDVVSLEDLRKSLGI